jgi:hypothetical protein
VQARSFATHLGQNMTVQHNGVPLSTSSHPKTYGNFDLIKQVKLDFTDVEISKWKSRRTGLSVVHLDYDGALMRLYDTYRVTEKFAAPIVNGYFVVATESE